MIHLLVKETEDEVARENMKRLQKELGETQKILKAEWKFFEISIDAAVTNFKVQHRLGFQPKDVIQTSSIGAGALTWNYSLFDKTNLDITTTGAVTVRAFVGSYIEEATT